MNIECLRRTNRAGYKAGAMKEVKHVCNSIHCTFELHSFHCKCAHQLCCRLEPDIAAYALREWRPWETMTMWPCLMLTSDPSQTSW